MALPNFFLSGRKKEAVAEIFLPHSKEPLDAAEGDHHYQKKEGLSLSPNLSRPLFGWWWRRGERGSPLGPSEWCPSLFFPLSSLFPTQTVLETTFKRRAAKFMRAPTKKLSSSSPSSFSSESGGSASFAYVPTYYAK